ncbi:hypothetical protein PR202_gb01527 [Eleusine coracana subsp. coracana]|uniref:GDSL esterase/lipase n=1 Tax=Eleusine coracana subsp. coracana TaxID=191504 RepID=A0AAV5DW39_ELECO|nr:hypothetical protein QOZ80_5BG0417550 [Eleusine coracana subsp. coracana]GJN14672.1 hypothetical protein PR202_gb01527 [Eleusine coracana subsp. coracana]
MARATATAAAAFFLAAAAVLLSSSPLAAAARATPPSRSANKHGIPAVFAFGDSTLDPGNNNRLITLVRADHAPYGRDFQDGRATGRFSDGKLITDYIVESLGIKDLLPAYHDPSLTVAASSTGVSFASGGSGLDDLTATTAMVSTFGSQIGDFQQLLRQIGSSKAADIAGKALYVLSAGTNDFAMYETLPLRAGSYPTVDQYSDYLVGKYQYYIKSLYNLGARNFMVAGLPPVGCLPMQKTVHLQQPLIVPGGCIEGQNAAAERYNTKLKQMLKELEADSPGSTFAYVDVYGPLKDMAANPRKYGFTQTERGCCGTGLVEMGELCASMMPQCPSPAQYMFFDSVHPTQATYKALADQIVQSQMPKFVK